MKADGRLQTDLAGIHRGQQAHQNDPGVRVTASFQNPY